MRIKRISIAIALSILIFVIGYSLEIAQIGSFKDVISSQAEHHSPPSVIIEQGSGVEDASYIIFKDDEGWLYAKNGDTGEIEFSGTDAATVIQSAINELSSSSYTENMWGGGRIYIRSLEAPPKIITLTSPIIVEDNVKLEFEEGIEVRPASDYGDMFSIKDRAIIEGLFANVSGVPGGFDHSVIIVDSQYQLAFPVQTHGGRSTQWTAIRRCRFHGDHHGTAIKFYAKYYTPGKQKYQIAFVKVENVYIMNFEYGILLDADADGTEVAWINGNSFFDAVIHGCKYGIRLREGSSPNARVRGNSFYNIQIQWSSHSDYGIYVDGRRNFFLMVAIWDTPEGELSIYMSNNSSLNYALFFGRYLDDGSGNILVNL